MVQKTIFGNPFETYSVIENVKVASKAKRFQVINSEDSIVFKYKLSDNDMILGMGQTMGSINKRKNRFVSFNTDTTNHFDGMPSLYGTHNFFVVDGAECFGVFVDTPSRVIFDFDYLDNGLIEITCETKDLILYEIDGSNSYEITKEFLSLIGQSFIPPLWAFGYIQSRWGYVTPKDFSSVVDGYKKANIPLDGVCMDIDYMRDYIDFTVNTKNFKDFKGFTKEMLDKGIHLIPIIDAAIKAKKGEVTRDEGVNNNLFCHKSNGRLFEGAVWPGLCYFPDFCKKETRDWFGSKFSNLTDKGIDGFWIDMNEPAIFYVKGSFSKLKNLFTKPQHIESKVEESKKTKEYKQFYQEYDGRFVCHYDVHNVYGHFMQMASGSYLKENLDRRYLLFSRSTYIGSHRYGGMWTGDNKSKWEHLERNLTQMVGLNMCGLIYSGADTGGFSGKCDRELLARWLSLSCFTPLFRNHASRGQVDKECYKFESPDDFRNIINLRYRLIPYIYSEFVKAALNKDMYAKPLCFVYKDKKSREVDDQLLIGDSIMIAPIMKQGKLEREVYLPEDMVEVRFDGNNFKQLNVKKGTHSICVKLDEVVFYIRKDKIVPISKLVMTTKDIDLVNVELLGNGKEYEQYLDDGYTKEVSKNNIRLIKK